ncbi:glucosaminidase domain-containing protein [Cohnella faecalis]|uniref:SH3b domain-containing protein n=1 Tax=Cohnella faecalis TaxID=2315694 RepID=A0A398CRN3_9BACL|nr:glucosaminidase domain-containing protein [Cohnella faecalis]RIE03448.1 hypothetical protein D3H35_12375 [Cohnella faecalis]
MRMNLRKTGFLYMLCVIVIFTMGMSFPAQHVVQSPSPTVNEPQAAAQEEPAASDLSSPFKLFIQPYGLATGLLQARYLAVNAAPSVERLPASSPVIQNEPSKQPIVQEPPETMEYTYEVTAYYLNVREKPNSKSKILNVIKHGTAIAVKRTTDNGWLELEGRGYVHADYAVLKNSKTVTAIAKTDEPVVVLDTIEDPKQPTSAVSSDSGLTEEHIATIFKGTALAGHGLEEAILDIEEEYGINAYFTIAVMKLESGNGKSRLAKIKNNLFGLNAIDGAHNKAFSFETKEDSVHTFGRLLSKSYVGKGYTTIEKIAKKYCPSNPKWPGLVISIMKGDYKKL